ncbi:MAG: two-component system, OmpR family, response regulator [Abditibacteriota bacterium]|nr:two-component system, OmpR family, response regulator [Abditibacteriota bacterium]
MVLNKGRILSIEDDDDNSMLIKMLLEDNGFEVMRASTCAAALEHAKETDFDLFLLDSRLNDGHGIELCLQLRELQPLTPVAFYTGVADSNCAAEALRAGATDYLIKPLSARALVQRIENILVRAQG